MKEVWYCETCQQVGCVELEPHTDVYSAIHAINTSHRRLSPTCAVPVEGMRVINTALVTSKEVLEATATIPRWVVAPAAALLNFQHGPEKQHGS